MEPRTFDDLYAEAETHDDYWLAGLVHDFTENLFVRMEEKSVSRAELARRLGTSAAYVTKILRGNANFTLSTMLKLARALDCDLQVLLLPRVAEGEAKPSKILEAPAAAGG